MAITATKTQTFERELIPAGNYVARCYRMIEIGTVPTEYMGEQKMVHKVRIGWELPTETKVFNEEKGEQPFVIDKEYTLSLGEKANLRRDLQSWRGKAFTDQEAEAFDITKLLGVPCMLNIIHVQGKKDPTKTYQAIGSISPMPKGLECPTQINPTFVFELESFDVEKFNSLPDFIKEQIMESEQYKSLTTPHKDEAQPESLGKEFEDEETPF
jgi:hypothetical protein